MVKQKLDPQARKAILGARKLIEEVAKADGNEAETRKRVEYVFGSVMGYDVFNHVTQEHAIAGAGDTVHCDMAIQLDHEDTSRPEILVELKRVNIDLAPKHLKQVASYAIDKGCDWAILSNGKEWRLYHISFGKPPQTKLVDSWNLLTDDLSVLAGKFEMIGYRNVRKGGLDKLWEKTNVLTARNILGVILTEDSIRDMQKRLKKATGVAVSPEDVVAAVRHLLNESAATQMDQMKISLPEKKNKKAEVMAKRGRPRKQPETSPPVDSLPPVQEEDIQSITTN